MNNDFFKMNRSIFEHPIWHDPVQFRLFFFLVGKAVWKEEGVLKGNVLVKRGQWLVSYRMLQRELEFIENNAIKQYPISRIKRAIDKLVASEMVQKLETELGTLFTIVNYEKYQGKKQDESEKENGAWNGTWNKDGTASEQHRNNKKKEKNIKNNNNIQHTADPEQNWFMAYEVHYGQCPTPIIIQTMNSFLDDGMEEKLLAHAIKKAAENGQRFNYAKGILNNWINKNVFTLEQAFEEEENYNKRREGKTYGKRSTGGYPTPKVKGTDPRLLDFSNRRNSL
ncbi:MAG: DnaD domain-containing protein [Bacillus sp. (in: firmicutes)]